MLTFHNLLKRLRAEANMTQQQFADALGISKILLVLLENGKKEPSRKFINHLAKKLHVHPLSIMPFLTYSDSIAPEKLSRFEIKLISLGESLQKRLIKQTAQYFTQNA
jgi:transcriptional regulator with XRE-family HTH domain